MWAPLVDWWGSSGRAGSQDAGPVELYCRLGDMMALLGSKLSVFSCCVLYNGNEKYSLFLKKPILTMKSMIVVNISSHRFIKLKLKFALFRKHTSYTPFLHTWWSVPDSHDHMLLNTKHGAEKKHYDIYKKIGTYCTITALFYSLYFHFTSCQVETNHWTLRCFWQRLMKQDSWLEGFCRPAHTLSGSVCVRAPGLVLVHRTVLFFKPLPHLREHCKIKGSFK